MDHLLAIGIPRVQIALDPFRTQPAAWNVFPQLCAEKKIEMISGMFGTVGEDYSTMESIRLTGGIVPDSTWDENWENIQSIAEIAARLRLPLVTFHAGFLPHDENDPEVEKLRHRIRLIADVFAARQIDLAFETGQETAESLRHFLEKLGRSNVGVNFDPANMILYEKGNPTAALKALGPWVRQCHLKDATKTTRPGTWGEEVTVGTGQVQWKDFFRVLEEIKFDGYLAIEREAGTTRREDIEAAKRFVTSLS
jgi:sugar phosphate isomerase/epimerase